MTVIQAEQPVPARLFLKWLGGKHSLLPILTQHIPPTYPQLPIIKDIEQKGPKT